MSPTIPRQIVWRMSRLKSTISAECATISHVRACSATQARALIHVSNVSRLWLPRLHAHATSPRATILGFQGRYMMPCIRRARSSVARSWTLATEGLLPTLGHRSLPVKRLTCCEPSLEEDGKESDCSSLFGNLRR